MLGVIAQTPEPSNKSSFVDVLEKKQLTTNTQLKAGPDAEARGPAEDAGWDVL
jgi:hypothetical protein